MNSANSLNGLQITHNLALNSTIQQNDFRTVELIDSELFKKSKTKPPGVDLVQTEHELIVTSSPEAMKKVSHKIVKSGKKVNKSDSKKPEIMDEFCVNLDKQLSKLETHVSKLSDLSSGKKPDSPDGKSRQRTEPEDSSPYPVKKEVSKSTRLNGLANASRGSLEKLKLRSTRSPAMRHISTEKEVKTPVKPFLDFSASENN